MSVAHNLEAPWDLLAVLQQRQNQALVGIQQRVRASQPVAYVGGAQLNSSTCASIIRAEKVAVHVDREQRIASHGCPCMQPCVHRMRGEKCQVKYVLPVSKAARALFISGQQDASRRGGAQAQSSPECCALCSEFVDRKDGDGLLHVKFKAPPPIVSRDFEGAKAMIRVTRVARGRHETRSARSAADGGIRIVGTAADSDSRAKESIAPYRTGTVPVKLFAADLFLVISRIWWRWRASASDIGWGLFARRAATG